MKKIGSLFLSVILIFCVLTGEVFAADKWTCPNCGNENMTDYCGNCGLYVHEVTKNSRVVEIRRSNSWFCLECGEINNQNFCTTCGHKRHEGLIGSLIFFGGYEQDNDIMDGDEKIEWIVTDEEDNRITLLARYLLDTQEYDISHSKEWKTSSLRTWLNDRFLNQAFNGAERDMLYKNIDDDFVGLLHFSEMNRILTARTSRAATPTKYAKTKPVDWSNLVCWFFNNGGSAGYIYGGGSSTGETNSGGSSSCCYIRPSIIIDLSKYPLIDDSEIEHSDNTEEIEDSMLGVFTDSLEKAKE